MLLTGRLMNSDRVRTYVPGSIRMVVFDAIATMAACNCASVETWTTVPEGGGSGGALEDGLAFAAPARNNARTLTDTARAEQAIEITVLNLKPPGRSAQSSTLHALEL